SCAAPCLRLRRKTAAARLPSGGCRRPAHGRAPAAALPCAPGSPGNRLRRGDGTCVLRCVFVERVFAAQLIGKLWLTRQAVMSFPIAALAMDGVQSNEAGSVSITVLSVTP